MKGSVRTVENHLFCLSSQKMAVLKLHFVFVDGVEDSSLSAVRAGTIQVWIFEIEPESF